MAELIKRIIVAVIGIPIAIGLIYAGGYVFLLAIILFSNLVLWEFYQLPTTKNVQPNSFFGLVFNSVFLALVFLFSQDTDNYIPALKPLVLVIFIFPMIEFLIQIFSKSSNTTTNASVTIAGAVWVSFSFASLIAIRFFPNLSSSLNLVSMPISPTYRFLNEEKIAWFFIAILASIWICDSFAYFVGKAIGRHRLAPKVSPNKTIEGAIAGVVGAFVGFYLSDIVFSLHIPIIYMVIFTGVVGIVGQIGDLAESKIKRDYGVKDSSNILPGHGGLLDRFDSIMFVFPTILIFLLVSILYR